MDYSSATIANIAFVESILFDLDPQILSTMETGDGHRVIDGLPWDVANRRIKEINGPSASQTVEIRIAVRLQVFMLIRIAIDGIRESFGQDNLLASQILKGSPVVKAKGD